MFEIPEIPPKIPKTKNLLFIPILLLSLTFFLAPHLSIADFYLHKWEDQFEEQGVWRAKLEGMLYLTTQNFSNLGTPSPVTGLQSLLRNQDDLTLSVGLFPRLSLFGRLSWAFINLNSSSLPGTGFGLADQSVGLNLRMIKLQLGSESHSKTATLDLQLQTDFPGYSNAVAASNGVPFLGDGSTDLSGGIFLMVPFHKDKEGGFSTLLGTGLTYQTLTSSTLVPWSTFFQFLPAQEGWMVKLGASGFFPLNVSNSTNTNLLSSGAGNGGSFLTGAVQPSLLQVDARLGYQISPISQIFVSATQSLWGLNAPDGLCFSLAFQKRFGTEPRLPDVKKSPSDYGKSNGGFLTYSLDAKVLRANDRLSLIKIDKGLQDGVEVGQIFDIFIVGKDGTASEAMARGRVTHVRPSEAALEITDYYKEELIEEGSVAKRLIE